MGLFVSTLVRAKTFPAFWQSCGQGEPSTELVDVHLRMAFHHEIWQTSAAPSSEVVLLLLGGVFGSEHHEAFRSVFSLLNSDMLPLVKGPVCATLMSTLIAHKHIARKLETMCRGICANGYSHRIFSLLHLEKFG